MQRSAGDISLILPGTLVDFNVTPCNMGKGRGLGFRERFRALQELHPKP